MSDVKLRKILLPLDGSDASFHAAKYAVTIAKHEGASLICVHAVSKPTYWYEKRYADWREAYYDEAKKVAGKWFEKVRKMAGGKGIEIKTDVITDVTSVVEAIVKYAEERDVGLIVIGTKGTTGLKRFLLGSVANGVILHSHCPVLVVR
ncbi:MAG: universal stress protein [Nitrososphaerales archaeon]